MARAKYGGMVQVDLICNMCGVKCPTGAWLSVGKVYEGHFSANRTNEDTKWSADLCPECQEIVASFIQDIAAEKNGRGVEKFYRDPMGQ